MVGLSENGKTCHFLAFLGLFVGFYRAFVRRKLNCHEIVTPTQVSRLPGCGDRRQSVQNWGFFVGPNFPDPRFGTVSEYQAQLVEAVLADTNLGNDAGKILTAMVCSRLAFFAR